MSAQVLMARHLVQFDRSGYDKGRSKLWQALWFGTMNLVWSKWWLPVRMRPPMLNLFGGKVGSVVFIRHRVRVLWPWKLQIGDDCWIGEDAWLLDLEPIILGNDVCISQGAFLCTGNHDATDPRVRYRNRPIEVGPGAWIGAWVFISLGRVVPPGAFVQTSAGKFESKPVLANLNSLDAKEFYRRGGGARHGLPGGRVAEIRDAGTTETGVGHMKHDLQGHRQSSALKSRHACSLR
jgi:putative colanic acid biosynthesis acetyltransferase WcaF